ncbi:NACHT domain-containing protein [Candidatus Thiosymbion oneisti]|uniref:NACHT domain-containing protein n=1 Tax=Candidatus Thiosymbion oneisti TaxID=589554 RepID=UPI000A736BE6|nr:NACHT domain-containing protein [Candidatus Thiosymbion oneisti]
MVFVLMGVLIVNYFTRDTTTMREHLSALELSESEGLMRLGRVLRNDLAHQDIETHWSGEFFEPLDAEVEVKRRGRIMRRTASLLEAITKEHAASTLLVLGDPGSGKSVALRKLAGDLVDEVAKTRRLPLYINLRDWRPNRVWSREDPPTPGDFEEFLLSHISGRDLFADRYLNEQIGDQSRFAHLLADRRIFLILDSFDEIPQLLDQSEASWLIDALSDVIYGYIAGGHNGRGILASRYFRRPSLKYRADATFEIRPFSDEQLASSLERRSAFGPSQVLALFRERPHLIPALRNPFIAGLVPGFSKINPERLPDSELDLFETYLDERLGECIRGARGSGDTPRSDLNRLTHAATDIAVTLVDNFGLEAPLAELTQAVGAHTGTTAETAEIAARTLRYGRVVRIGSGIDASFSFVHRRFTEFFLAKHLQNDHDRLPLGDIPNDGRWREALTLFAGVAPPAEAEVIAKYCIEYACRLPAASRNPTSHDFLAGVHALRFLSASFRARREVLAPHDPQLVNIVRNLLRPSTPTLAAKIGSEAIGLLPSTSLSRLVPKALALPSDWIGQTAIRSCRHLAGLSKKVVGSIRGFVIKLPQKDFSLRHRELRFSLSLTENLASVARTVQFRRFDTLLALGAPLPLLAVDVTMIIAAIILFLFTFFIFKYYFLFLIDIHGWLRAKYKEKKRKTVTNRKAIDRKIRHWMRMLIPPWLYRLRGVVRLRQQMRRRHMATSLNRNFDWGSTLVFFLWRLLLLVIGASILAKGDSNFWSFAQVLLPDELLYAGSITGMTLAVPWFHSWVAIRNIVKNPHLIYFLVILLLLVGLSALLVWIIDIVIKLLPFLTPLIFGGGTLVYLGFFVWSAVRLIRQSRHDAVQLRSIKPNRSWTREQIAAQLSAFESSKGRLKFLSMLDEQRVTPEGEWPEPGIPSLNNTQLDTVLAQLEERWLGLNG